MTTRPSATTSPLDSTIAGSAKRNTTSPSSVRAAAAAPSTKGTATATRRRAHARRPLQQLGQPRPHRPGLDQLVVLLADAAALDRRAGADRAQQRVARRVLALDELQPRRRGSPRSRSSDGPQRVGQGVGEPLAQDAVPGEQGVRRGRGVAAQLRGDVVVAAGRGQHQRGPPLDGAGQRLVGRGVAGVQREHHLGRLGSSCAPRDRADHEVRRRRRARPRRSLLWSRDCSFTSTPVSRTGSPRTAVRKRCAAKVR